MRDHEGGAGAGVQRHEGLVEQQQVRLDRKGPRQRGAPGKPERQFAGVPVAVIGQTQGVENGREVAAGQGTGQGEAHVLLDRAPREQTRLLEDDTEAATTGAMHLPVELRVEPCHDPQHRALPAARLAEDGPKGPRLEAETQVLDREQRRRDAATDLAADVHHERSARGGDGSVGHRAGRLGKQAAPRARPALYGIGARTSNP